MSDINSIRSYLTTSPVLASPIKEKPLVVYIIAFKHSIGALLAQENVEG